jgi:hypothetical protein
MLQSSLVGHGSGQRSPVLDSGKGRNRAVMTPKDKAIELYIKYIDAYNDRNLQVSDYKFAKQCALIAVDEILLLEQKHILDKYIELGLASYYQEVKQEIERL